MDRKPRNARSKRALEAREPKEVEDARTAIFVRGTHAGEVVQNAMKELMALKKPNAISFSKKNDVRPFEDASSLEFWAQKNDASIFVVGQSTKKRPNGLVMVRTFDSRVLDMCEFGVDSFVSMAAFKTTTVGGAGLDDPKQLPKVHVRTYTAKLVSSGTRVPRVELTEMGPRLDLSLRRWQEADPEMWKAAMRRPKMKKQDVEKGLGKRKKNIEVDEMGDMRGRVHVGKQDLGKLQTRKMKGLKSRGVFVHRPYITVGTALPSATSQSPTSISVGQPTSTTPTPPATTTNGVTSNPLTSPTTTTSSSSTTSAQSSTHLQTRSRSAPHLSHHHHLDTHIPESPNDLQLVLYQQGRGRGVFSVVGLIVIVLAIVLIINTVRRRRAQKFDRDVAEAAAEAAASPRSPFDDYNGNGGGGGGYGYSDNSHGTYQLPPLSPQHGAYGMSEMSQYDPYAAGAASLAASAVGRSRSRKDSEPGTPGIAGVGAGTLAREPSKRAPYHAFAGPGPQLHELQRGNGTFRSGRGNQDILEAAGLAGTGAAAATMTSNNLGNNASGTYVTRKPSEATQHTLSGRSNLGSMSSGSHHPTTLHPGYPVDSYYPQRSDTLSPDPFAVYPPVLSAPSNSLPNPYDVSAPLPSPPEHQTDLEDPVDPGSPTALRSDEQRMSYQDNADYSQGNRILRVANE
ncbi:hypothetical protein JVT61DRAFT_2632 [Boletus reticuloceps]|uniref:Ribosome production factor 2 homolog n=1 Tax=Boletus reticuloceps TaxID=495285 RepID=A0A8I2YQV4_9AGAM|nr:hypothetical protein JVT61DRAFT_2632 [Boletus reticuloceps]